MPVEIYHEPGGSAFGGSLILVRQFYNSAEQDCIRIEAHEVRDNPHLPDGVFQTAIWRPGFDNDSDGSEPTELHELVRWMQEYAPPAGFVEGRIPPYILEGREPTGDGK